MGQSGIATGLFVCFLVVLGTVNWSNGASLPEPGRANQMDDLCKQLALNATAAQMVPPNDETAGQVGRCLGLYAYCNFNTDCCSNRCEAYSSCELADQCLPPY